MKAKATSSTAWKKWRIEAVGRFRLEDVYGDILTGRKQGDGWLEARDPRSKSGDRKPSCGVSDGTGDCERGRFKSFIDDCNLSVFDYLAEIKGHDLHKTYKIIAESSGVALPVSKPESNGKTKHDTLARKNVTTNGTDTSTNVVSGFKAEWIDSPTFFQRDYRPRWLVKRLLARGQPIVVGGPKKALKTTLIVDLAISLGSGTAFLGYFDVYSTGVPVVLLSGESGEYTLQETGKRMCGERDLDPTKCGVHWGFQLPQLSNPTDLSVLGESLKRDKIEVAFIDPLYLCMLTGLPEQSASNMYVMGPLLLNAARACLSVGCTPCLVHHTRMHLTNPYRPLDGHRIRPKDNRSAALAWTWPTATPTRP